MPIWSFTQERLDKLKEQISKKKAEELELEARSEKDLWCQDLDEFEAEWQNQLRLDAEVTSNIRKMGRRASKKIGAGRPGGRKAKGDDEWAPPKSKATSKAATKPKVVQKPVEMKTHQRFAEKFAPKPQKPAVDGAEDSDAFSDDDYAALKSKPASKPAKKEKPITVDDEESEEEIPLPTRGKRAAATKAKTWVVDDDESESEDDDDKMLGDVGAMVKGISSGNAGSSSEKKTGRLSLFAMSRPESSHSGGGGAGLKVKSKPSKTFDFDDDDTNYELLAKSSPHKTSRNEIDSFLSDDDLPAVTKPTGKAKASTSSEEPKSKSAAASSSTAGAAAKKGRGRTATTKSKVKEDAPPKKAVQLSPAAKALGAKKGKAAAPKKKEADVFDIDDSDEEEDVEMAEVSSPPPRPAGRSRPGRAAASKAKPIYIDDDDDSDEQIDDFDEDSD